MVGSPAKSPRVVGLMGSPREAGNTDLLVTAALEAAAAAGAQTVKFSLGQMRISPCRACRLAPDDSRYCRLPDDMEVIYRALEEAEAVVVASPIYYGTVSAQLKLLIDRCNCLSRMVRCPGGEVSFRRRLRRQKRAACFLVSDLTRDFQPALAVIRLFLRELNAELMAHLCFSDSEARPLAGRPMALEAARAVGRQLVTSGAARG